MKISEECIEAIEKESASHYPTIDNRNQLISMHTLGYCRGAKYALTNPSIYSKAGLISLEDAYNFFNWTIDNKWYMIKKNNWYNPRIDKKEENTLTTAQLFQIYQEQKEK